ncbi:glycine oxidase [Streptoalloteichus tenebrarius]|uniref:glycine oxidase n=1 Tax=Streptoalloteichus tenebrarius (strain ATCC 17920 / DSM 40477 / JCM 4838 / CBS 697.72 / NBRC 16177 / NCIMB 11028 / NRRL B-12390 / A12253. 1 / ISP 5477) TaxID=1933 RepID=A0ABT1HYK5_STRSD|nr:glycine oxidase ThiO [Streptoalloteichus tenebrarius]MCP2260601.1 glycine oxidase [Streptoalloteichus tenebrarius]BFF01482.1 glycine oxidase ThiO [Streptoalloteichus tenebrarius]
MSSDVVVGSRVAVVGGGVVGLSAAWLAASSGFAVTLVDPCPARGGASWVAGGMLAPVTEAWPGEEAVLALGSDSLARWPDFAARLRADSGADPGLDEAGTLVVAVDGADAEVLRVLADHLAGLGRAVRSLTGRELRRLEPGLGPSVRCGLDVPGDLAVDNRALLTALLAACERRGVRFDRRRVASVDTGRVHLDDGSTVDTDVVVVCAGAWSGSLHPALAGLIRPVKGEILRLRARRGALPPPSRTVRALVEGRPAYLVPRRDGLVLGATQYEAGFDADVTVGGVRDLLRDAERVMPGLAEYALDEAVTGFRAGSPDNLPLIGEVAPGVLVAAGHHRNGLLLAPVTAEAVLAMLRGDVPPESARVADPARLAAVSR